MQLAILSPMKRTSFAGIHCSLARTLEIMGDWWTPLIVRDLFLGVTRFDDLIEDLGVSRNLLATRLKLLEGHGLIERRPYQDNPVRYEYALTEAGCDLVPSLTALTAWGDRWASPPGGPPALFEHRTCGKMFRPEVRCPHCGDLVRAQDTVVHRGPGSKAARGTRVVARLLS
jgi:DNA-binding HxlR family transcriptional regulator